MSGNWSKIGTFCGKRLPNAIVANATIKVMFDTSTDNEQGQGGSGFKIMFYLSSEYPAMLINLSELNHMEGLRVLYQDLISKVNVKGKSTKY